jgi:hypothetical protein
MLQMREDLFGFIKRSKYQLLISAGGSTKWVVNFLSLLMDILFSGGSKGGRKTWLKRWFALKRGALYYYAGKSKDAVLLGIMPIISNLCVTCHHMGITTFTSDSSVYDHGSQYAPPPVWKLSEKCKFCDVNLLHSRNYL